MYAVTDDNGKKVGNPIKASHIGDYATLPQIEKLYAGNKEYLQDLPRRKALADRIRRIVTDSMKQGQTSQTEVERALEQKNITAVFRTNEVGRLTGATFIDHQGKTVYNGSNLGKHLSANCWHSLFNESAEPLYQRPTEQSQTVSEADESTLIGTPTELPPLTPVIGGITDEYEVVLEHVPDEDRGPAPSRKTNHNGLGLFETLPCEQIDPEVKTQYKKKKRRKCGL